MGSNGWGILPAGFAEPDEGPEKIREKRVPARMDGREPAFPRRGRGRRRLEGSHPRGGVAPGRRPAFLASPRADPRFARSKAARDG
ncbi:hypothetical protein GCM10009416_29870 [Craurococcus roseus]|uniref:Uncharacterized protein n=1 Tax=Craurococcus roseus TaxID=77585 RepID=A0ABP3QEI7_9PROT